MKRFILALTPDWCLRAYHYSLAWFSARWYGNPTRAMVVIGVTGTNGKSTTVELIGRICLAAGYKVGWTSTATMRVGEREWLNKSKMTMLGRFALQKLLSQMLGFGTQIAIVETSSQGLMQYRHLGIDYDVAVFTNLTPEHIEAHGGFENYKKAKGILFQNLKPSFAKGYGGQAKKLNNINIPKTIVVNLDDPYASYFLSFPADQKIGFSLENVDISQSTTKGLSQVLTAKMINVTSQGSKFEIDGCPFDLSLLGRHNIYNVVAAIAATRPLQIPFATANEALDNVGSIPGRVEFINEGQLFKVMVDYAPEPVGLRQLYVLLEKFTYSRLIHVLGSAGGGRDKARRRVLGRMAAQKADVVIITNEDPYDEDPQNIVAEVAAGAEEEKRLSAQKKNHKWLKANGHELEILSILDRREAINKAIELAKPNDLVLITGKGCEQAMCVANGKKIPWDDREVVREAIRKFTI